MSEDVTTDVMTKLLRDSLRQEEIEVYAAWRAGYNYLHVLENIDPSDFTYRRKFIPHNYMEPPTDHSARTYDLRPERLDSKVRKMLRKVVYEDLKDGRYR